MSEADTDAIATGTPDQRLHPWSWLFVLLQQLRQFIVPLLVLMFAGRGDHDAWPYAEYAEYAPLAGVLALVVVSVLQYFTYRYRIGAEGISIRSGLLQRNLREIPFTRIHNVGVHQSLLHRLFGVAEVRLESAGGNKPEGQMRVLGLQQALALEQLVRHHGSGAATTTGIAERPDGAAPAGQADGRTLLSMPLGEVVRMGLVSNRGMLVVAAAAGLVAQASPERMMGNWLEQQVRGAAGYAEQLHLGWLGMASAALVLVAVAMAAIRLLSVALALSQYYGFRLIQTQGRLVVERGLFARLRTSVAPRRIQAWYQQETLLHRWFGRRALRIDTATGGGENDPRKLRELAPIATPAACEALFVHLLPGVQWPPAAWQGVPRRCWWRLFASSVPWTVLLVAVLWWHLGPWSLLAALWLPWSAYAAWQQAGRLGYVVDARLLAVRGGWWSRWWRMAELDKVQALQLQRSPLDRLLGTASLWLDTAGAGPLSPPLRIRFLPHAEARALHARLGRVLAARRMRW